MCRFEYRDDFRSHVQFLRELFREIYDRDPICNEMDS
jgi:hypothetical protein